MKLCLICHKEFTHWTKKRAFCLDHVGSTIVCEVCGKSFTNTYSDHLPRFCSRSCKVKFFHNPETDLKEYICQWCGKTFKRRAFPCRSPKYCSKSCQGSGSGTDRWKDKPKAVTTYACEHCGKVVTRKTVTYNKQARHFCSSKCAFDSGASPGFKGNKLRDGRRTDIETIVETFLKANGVDYTFEYPIGRYYIDFALVPHKIAIECDGEYWHNRPEDIKSDKRKNDFLAESGWIVLRLPGAEIKSGVYVQPLTEILKQSGRDVSVYQLGMI